LLRGVRLTSRDEADAVLCMDEVDTDLPVLRLTESIWPGRITVSETVNGTDQRPQRLYDLYGASIDQTTISIVLSGVRPSLGARPDELARVPPHQRANRDAVRRWLAVDGLFNAASRAPEDLADLIADAVHAATRKASRVSIVINNYNYGDFLPFAIDSALNQNEAAHEIIVVDDGSTDQSRDIISNSAHVTAVLKENGGQGSAFNAGFAASSGDLIVFLDADDCLLPEAVSILAKQDLTTAARFSFGLETIDTHNTPCGLYPMSRRAASGLLKGPLLTDGFLMMMPTSGTAYPRSTLETILPMPEPPWRISADVYLAFAAIFKGPNRHLDHVLGQYRLHGANAYHAVFGAEAPFNERKMRQRRQAFGDIATCMERVGAYGSPRDIATLAAMAEPASADKANAAAAADHDAPRLTLDLPPLAHDDLPTPPEGDLFTHLSEADPARQGGGATWPILQPGQTFDLTRIRGETALGPGWTPNAVTGPALTGAFGVVAVCLPGPRADWMIMLSCDVAAPCEIGLWINRTRHAPIEIDPSGRATVRITGTLLDYEPMTRTWRVAMTLIPPADVTLTAWGLTAVRAHSSATGAPVLHTGQTVQPTDIIADQILASGWHWPSPDGAVMAKADATLRFTIAAHTDHTLHVMIDPPPLMVTHRGTALTTHPDACGHGLHVRLPGAEVRASGVVELNLVAADPCARPRLSALVLHPDKTGGDAPPMGYFADPHDLNGLVPSENDLKLSFAAPLNAPLVLRFEAEDPGAQSQVDIRFGDQMIAAALMGDAVLQLAPDADCRTLSVEITGDHRMTGLTQRSGLPAGPMPQPGRTLNADALAACAATPGLWQNAEGDALWLLANRAALRLPAPPTQATRLTVTALTLPGAAQTLTLRLGENFAATAPGGGLQTLTLELGDARDKPLHLRVETDLLVSTGLVGSDGQDLLGGALVAVSYDTDAAQTMASEQGISSS
jgi:hypothetical protein